MWIMTSNGETIIDAAKCNRIFAADKGDAILVSAGIDGNGTPVTICKTATMKGATDLIREIVEWIACGESPIYYAPENFPDSPMARMRDSRVKRKGGS